MQLSLFDNQWQPSANNLLSLLNDGRKGKDLFYPLDALKIKDKVVIIAQNAECSVFNVLDTDGNTPVGESACWRVVNKR
jgi:hypothetical protein